MHTSAKKSLHANGENEKMPLVSQSLQTLSSASPDSGHDGIRRFFKPYERADSSFGGISLHEYPSGISRNQEEAVAVIKNPTLNQSPWVRKPLWTVSQQNEHHQHDDSSGNVLHRHLDLFDLICIGVGSTIGSGIFVLCGVIARNYAGPATPLSWSIAGMAACLSGCCYAELSGRIPSAGSSYAYTYVAMGELPAVIAAACLTLEYVFSASAVARSWGDKVIEWLMDDLHENEDLLRFLSPGYNINIMAFLVSTVSVVLLMMGVKESKAVMNFFTVTKVLLVLFMTMGGMLLMKRENLSPFIPPEFGLSGMFRGASSSFFAYIGYDEICCLAGEAKNPTKNMPRAIIITLVFVTFLYMLASIALTGMCPYEEISATSAFPAAFRSNGVVWAAQITAAGEILVLPIVVLITIMAQPRLQYAMAQDGLIPKFLGEVDEYGNLQKGTIFSGILMIAVSTFIPFVYLDDLISAGILIAFSMTDCSVILLRHEAPYGKPKLLVKLLVLFNGLSFMFGLLLSNGIDSLMKKSLAFVLCLGVIITGARIGLTCPRSLTFGGKNGTVSTPNQGDSDAHGEKYFQTPFVPYLPLFGCFVNCYLIAQLESEGLLLLILYLASAVIFYFLYGMKNSLGNKGAWLNDECEAAVGETESEVVTMNDSGTSSEPLFRRVVSKEFLSDNRSEPE